MSKKTAKPVPLADNSTDGNSTDSNDKILKELSEIKKIVKSFKNELLSLIELQKSLIHGGLGVPVPPPSKEYIEETTGSGSSKVKIDISNYGNDRIKISGKTFDYKEAIKAAERDKYDAKFEQSNKSWTLPLYCLDKLVSNLEGVNLVRDVDFSVNVKTMALENKQEKEKEEEEEEEDGGFGSGFS